MKILKTSLLALSLLAALPLQAAENAPCRPPSLSIRGRCASR